MCRYAGWKSLGYQIFNCLLNFNEWCLLCFHLAKPVRPGNYGTATSPTTSLSMRASEPVTSFSNVLFQREEKPVPQKTNVWVLLSCFFFSCLLLASLPFSSCICCCVLQSWLQHCEIYRHTKLLPTGCGKWLVYLLKTWCCECASSICIPLLGCASMTVNIFSYNFRKQPRH